MQPQPRVFAGRAKHALTGRLRQANSAHKRMILWSASHPAEPRTCAHRAGCFLSGCKNVVLYLYRHALGLCPTSKRVLRRHSAQGCRGNMAPRSKRGAELPCGEDQMLHYAVVFFIIALIAAVFGFGGIAAGAVGIAKVLFFIFLILAVVSFIANMARRT